MTKTEKPVVKKKTPKKKHPKPKTSSRAKNYSFIDVDGKEIALTDKQHKFGLEYLRLYGKRVDAIVEAGYDVFYRDKDGEPTENINYNLARVMANENLSNPNINAFITVNMSKFGWDDDNVELQHLGLINQHENLPTKQRAISDWYKLKGKYPAEKHEHSGTIEMIELTNYGDKKKS